VVYAALDVATVDLELVRSARRDGVTIDMLGPRRLATIRVRFSRVLDLTSDQVRSALGIRSEDIIADDPAVPRAIGEAAHHLGYEAVLAPSAAGLGQVLAIFLDNRAADSVLEVVKIRDGHVPGHGAE